MMDDNNKGNIILSIIILLFVVFVAYTLLAPMLQHDEVTYDNLPNEYSAAIDSLPFDVGDYVISTQEFNETFNTSVYGKIKRISIFGESVVIIENETSGGICQEYTYAVENNIVYSTSYNTPTWCREIHSDKRFFEVLK